MPADQMRGKMKKKATLAVLAMLGVLSGACSTPPTHVPSTEARIVISEVMTGIQGNNNYEFIELYNDGEEIIDLNGWSLWYRLSNSEEDLPVIAWQETTLIPPDGHFLLGRAGEELDLPVDGVFEQALNTSGGGIALRESNGSIADALGWGTAPANFTEGTGAPAPENGQSLERAPGGAAGNGSDTDNNASDFIISSVPAPQNSGSPLTPTTDLPIQILMDAPSTVEPGATFDLSLTVRNLADSAINDVTAYLTLPAELTISQQPLELVFIDDQGIWAIGRLEAGGERSLTLRLAAPWRYIDLTLRGAHVEARGVARPAFAAPHWTRIEGGVIPVEIARGMLGETITVVGTATMYTGGFYAGSAGTKFYLQDESGGIQVYVPDGASTVEVGIGDRVQVTGRIELYRGSIELVPQPEDVLVLDGGNPIEPQEIELEQTVFDATPFLGELVGLQGTAVRAEEFSYSYEVDLVDDQGHLLTLYLDKLTEMSSEPVDIGHQYYAVGILEVLDTTVRLNPRLQADLTEIFPPGLRIVADRPSSVLPGETFIVTLRVFNNTAETLDNVVVRASLPNQGANTVEMLDGGTIQTGNMEWRIGSLEGDGAMAEIRFHMTAPSDVGQIDFVGLSAETENQVYPSDEPLRVFIGTGVPIWAIQGEGDISPYKLETLTTQGIVTGVFPELFGFWIQEIETDDDDATSAGLFISLEAPQEPYTLEDLALPVEPGDLVQVTGQVREISQQTQIRLADLSDVTVLIQNSALPPAVELDPPVDNSDAVVYYEALEGMLVSVEGPAVAVAPISKYGEIALVLQYYGVNRLWRGSPSGMMITTDDGSQMVHYDRSTLPYVVQTGDQVEGLLGPLAFTFGQYKIELLENPIVTVSVRELPSLPALGENELGLMTWNVEDLFDILDPNPVDIPRLRLADYELALEKIANTILAAGAPTIVGLQEVENLAILEDLVELPSLAAFNYLPFLLEGTDSRGIDVGYLVRGDRANVLNVEQFTAPEGLTSRPPLLIVVEVHSDGGTETLYVLNNHFTALSGGEQATEPRRIAQAAWNAEVMETLLLADPAGHGVVMGDLNSFYDTPPIEALEAIGLQHVFDTLPPDERYTYIYQGISQTLDHILVTPELMARLLRVDVLRTNADYAPPIPGDDSPMRKSDHDAVVVVFSLVP